MRAPPVLRQGVLARRLVVAVAALELVLRRLAVLVALVPHHVVARALRADGLEVALVTFFGHTLLHAVLCELVAVEDAPPALELVLCYLAHGDGVQILFSSHVSVHQRAQG